MHAKISWILNKLGKMNTLLYRSGLCHMTHIVLPHGRSNHGGNLVEASSPFPPMMQTLTMLCVRNNRGGSRMNHDCSDR